MTACGGRPLGDAELDDSSLVEHASAGDVDAYERLVRRYQAVAWRTAYVITGSVPDAEDAAQEALVKAYSALPRFRQGASFRPWLLTIVANEARNRVRADGRQASLRLRIAVDADTPDPAPTPEASAEAAERRRALAAALGRLRGRDREVIAYRHLLGLSEAETAEVLGCARGTVKSALSRALARLRAILAEEGDCPEPCRDRHPGEHLAQQHAPAATPRPASRRGGQPGGSIPGSARAGGQP